MTYTAVPSSAMASLVTHEHAAVLDRVCGLAASIIGPSDPPGLIDFIRVLYADVSIDDLLARNVEDLASAARAMWRFALEREPGAALVRAYNPQPSLDGWSSANTVIEIVSDDMPFIVDSLTMEFDRRRCTLQFSAHPIVAVDRTEGRITGVRRIELAGAIESFVHVEIERIGDESELRAIESSLRVVLGEVRAATQDWIKMVAALRSVANDLALRPPRVPVNEVVETRDVLDWMANHHFTLLGTCEYAVADGAFVAIPEGALGLMHDPQRRGFPNDGTSELLTICKDPERSRIHRDTYLDAVTVRRYGDDGEVIGAWRCIGLWTSAAYNTSPVDIPMVRHKVQAVVQRAGFPPTSHSGKDLIAILEAYPRDELFQISEDELYTTATGIMQLNERRRVRVFARRDLAGQFATALVFVPRDRYTTTVRERIDALLTRSFAATGSEWTVRVTESALARVQFVLRLDPAHPTTPDVERIEAEIRSAIRSWPDELAVTLCDTYGEVHGNALARRYGEAFPAAYRDDVSVTDAATDIASLEQMRERSGLVVRLRATDNVPDDGDATELLFTIFAHREIPLSEAMPILGNLGVDVVDEHPYRCTIDGTATWIERFRVRGVLSETGDRDAQLRSFEAAFISVLAGVSDNDLFGTLVLRAQISWREAALLRMYARYMRQIGTPFSHDYIATALGRNPHIVHAIIDRFHRRFDPKIPKSGDAHAGDGDAIEEMLISVPSLDDDRIIRTYRNLVDATLRTNWFQRDDAGDYRPTVALKFAPSLIADIPKPVPAFEIFVDSPRVEGVHLRMGEVARGGLRWSDRREDFRTEVLGLVKAQSVKNAVIVPVGAKGGFVPKQLPLPSAGRDAWMAEGVAAYTAFVGALLDVTDNLIDGVVVHPDDTVRYDGDDHYLVVAADKGTATFSDIANQIATDRGFWLGDAFASGGSAGYDHKAMGITARGAWEAVQAHFRTLGIDTQTHDFTTVGIGDMSGDVFGNGMLLSPHVRLVAAFDHRHIFFDPTPDAASSFTERERLFALPRSSWADYDDTLLSPGGGVFDRSLKSIPIAPEVAVALGLGPDTVALAPNALVSAILRAPVDLLWNGGIGTYVKARSERNADVGDKANDNLRVDGASLRCKVVGEGGNLGFTQLGRIEFALQGGLINTDAIDNSAGVDTSDHEVNIKILVDRLVARDLLTLESRNPLLASLTDAIATQVLQDNYNQNRALLIAARQRESLAAVHERWISDLVERSRLDRELEYLPTTDDLKSRAANHGGLTSPEFAVMLAYTKADLTQALRQSDVLQDPEWSTALTGYFPELLQQQARDEIAKHPLRNEIVATTLANAVVNTAGTTMMFRLHTETGLSYATLVSAYLCAWRIFDQQQLWDDIAELDNQVSVTTQVSMYLESRKLVERATRWIARSRWNEQHAGATIDFFSAGVERCTQLLPKLLRGNEQSWILNYSAQLVTEGCPAPLAARVAQLDSLIASLDIIEGAHTCQRTVDDVAAVRAVTGDRLQLDWLIDRISDDLPRTDQWDALARDALRDDAAREYRSITTNVLAVAQSGDTADTAFERWAQVHAAQLERTREIFGQVSANGVFDLATLSVATRSLRALSSS